MTLTSLIVSVLASVVSTYTNPILHSDYSDPDLICVDGEYWMTASSFNCVPGLQILHSTNLVDWKIVNAGLPCLSACVEGREDALDFSRPQHGNAVWAPSIRYFNGKFWIFWGDPDHGVYQIHADHPSGQWSKPHCVWNVKGVIDTCPLCDEDGRIYMVHAYAGTRAGFKSIIAVCELNPECTSVISEQVLVWDGNKMGDKTIEGPKFYKRNGWYYIFAPAGGVKEGWQVVLRSKSVYGPYEGRIVMDQGATNIHGPHQGGWVEDAAGESWFVHFEDRYAYGRVVHLQPMRWGEDDWCVIGQARNGQTKGQPVITHPCPAAFPEKAEYSSCVDALETATSFGGLGIPLNWQWHADPRDGWALMNPADGCLRLNCIKNPEGWRNLWDTPNLLLEKIVGPSMTLEAKLTFSPSYEGDRCGMVVMGDNYSTIELVNQNNNVYLRRVCCEKAEKGGEEQYSDFVNLGNGPFVNVYLRLKVDPGNPKLVREGCICSFHYSLDGRKYWKLGESFTACAGKWIGAKAGFFATAQIKKNDGGSVEIR